MSGCVCGAVMDSEECRLRAHLNGPRPKARWVDLFGADPDFTGGRDVNDFLDEQRGEA